MVRAVKIQSPLTSKKTFALLIKILVADNTTVNLALATKLLKKRGHDIISVEDGLQAFEALRNLF